MFICVYSATNSKIHVYLILSLGTQLVEQIPLKRHLTVSDVDDIVDVHICGACREEFNDMKVFLQHKKECLVLRKRKQSCAAKTVLLATDSSREADQSQIEIERTDTSQHSAPVPTELTLASADLTVVDKQLRDLAAVDRQLKDLAAVDRQLSDGSTGMHPFPPPPGHEYAQTPRKKVKHSKDQDRHVPEVLETDDGRMYVTNKNQDKITLMQINADHVQFQELLQSIKDQQEAERSLSGLNARLNQNEELGTTPAVSAVVTEDQAQLTNVQKVLHMDLTHNGSYSLLPRSQLPNNLQAVTSFHPAVTEVDLRDDPTASSLPGQIQVMADNIQTNANMSAIGKVLHPQQQIAGLLSKQSLVNLSQLKENQNREPGLQVGQENATSNLLLNQQNLNNNNTDGIENVMYLGFDGGQGDRINEGEGQGSGVQYINIEALPSNSAEGEQRSDAELTQSSANSLQGMFPGNPVAGQVSHYSVHLQNVSHAPDSNTSSKEPNMDTQSQSEALASAPGRSEVTDTGSLEMSVTTEEELQESQVVEHLRQAYLKYKLERSKAAATRSLSAKQSRQIVSDMHPSKKSGSKGKTTPPKRYKCDFKENCPFTTVYLKDLERHIRTHTGEKPFQCSYCSKSYSRADKLKLHERGHTGEKPYACELCDYKAVDNGSLKKHMVVHSEVRPFHCQMCSYKCRTSSQLTVHLRVHTGDAPFTCLHCPAKFKIKSDMKRHLRIHTGDKPFKCDQCDIRCATKSNLRSHIKVHHSTDKQFKCQHCEYVTSSKRCFYEHKKEHHYTDPQCVCPVCKYICANKDSLKKHIQNTHEEKTYKCNDCDFTSTRKNKLLQHKKSHLTSLLKRTTENGQKKIKKEGKKYKGYEKLHKCDICNEAFVRKDSLKSHLRLHDERLQSKLSTALTVLELQQPVLKSGTTVVSGTEATAPSGDVDATELEKAKQYGIGDSDMRGTSQRGIESANLNMNHGESLGLRSQSGVNEQSRVINQRDVESRHRRRRVSEAHGHKSAVDKQNLERSDNASMGQPLGRGTTGINSEQIETVAGVDPRFHELGINEHRFIIVSSDLNNSVQQTDGRHVGINAASGESGVTMEQRFQGLVNQNDERAHGQGTILHSSSIPQNLTEAQVMPNPSNNPGTNLVVQDATANQVILSIQESDGLQSMITENCNVSDMRQDTAVQVQLPSIQLVQNLSFPVIKLPDGQLVTISGHPLTGQIQGESGTGNIVSSVNPMGGLGSNQSVDIQSDPTVHLISAGGNAYVTCLGPSSVTMQSEAESSLPQQQVGWNPPTHGTSVLNHSIVNTQRSGNKTSESQGEFTSASAASLSNRGTAILNSAPQTSSQQLTSGSLITAVANQNSLLVQSNNLQKSLVTSEDRHNQTQIDVQSIEMDATVSNYDVVFQNGKFHMVTTREESHGGEAKSVTSAAAKTHIFSSSTTNHPPLSKS